MATQIPTQPVASRIPILEQGDQLTRDEFERRYEAMPHVKKAELIEGIVYMPSPIRFEQHSSPAGRPHLVAQALLRVYAGHPCGRHATLRLDLDNEPQPDCLMFRDPNQGGRVVIGPSGYIEVPPELIGEIAASTVSYDMHAKLRVYRRNQVQEHIVWRVEEAAIDWFILRKGRVCPFAGKPCWIYQSEVFPGLWLDAAALIRSDLPIVLRVLEQGIASRRACGFRRQTATGCQLIAPNVTGTRFMATQIPTQPVSPGIPILKQGDQLTRDEFERRYEAMPEVKRAELLEGIVYMPSPVSYSQHGGPHLAFCGWLMYYITFTPGVGGGDNTTVRLDLDNEPQPDGLLFQEPSHGGRIVLGPRGFIEGAPELVGEIASSSVNYDMHTKLRVYRRNQVQEYIVWRVEEAAIDWFILRKGEYVRLSANQAGIYQSEVFPGLWLDAAALIRSDLPTVLRVLEQGIASPEHAAYVARLQQAAT